MTEFKVIMHALPFMWGDPNLWYRDRRDVPWDVFLPLINSWNEKQRMLFSAFRQIVLDESMVGWVPKTSKLGGLPNYVCEPRKPVPLGTMLKDAAESSTGIMVHADPTMTPSVQDQKAFGFRHTQSPDRSEAFESHPAHTAEVLRQVTSCGLQSGCWTGGDSWFGSVQTALALKLEEVNYNNEDGSVTRRPLDVESSWVIKNNTRLFPRGPLHAVLRARCPTRMAGHWVVFRSVIKGVNMLAIAYAWSNKDVAYVLTTVGNANSGPMNYISFDAGTCYDTCDTKQHPRPHIVDFLMRQLPIIDSYNSLRQHSLQIENKWPTKCPWRKLLHAHVGMSVVNMQKLYSHQHPGIEGKDMSVFDLAATISGALVSRKRRILPAPLLEDCSGTKMSRVADSAGNTAKRVTPKQKENDARSVGSSKQQTCFVCKKCSSKCSHSVGSCPKCNTCLCLNSKKRAITCLYEHLNSGDPNIHCNGVKKVRFPKESRADDCC